MTAASMRALTAMAAGALVLASGCLAQPTRPPGAGRVWQRVPSADQLPALVAPRLAFDAGRGHIVLYSGRNASGAVVEANPKAYQFDGSAWTVICDAVGLQPRFLPAFGYLPGVGLIVVGGAADEDLRTPRADTFGCIGETWTLLGSMPEERIGGQLVYDEVRGQLVLVGGFDSRRAPVEAVLATRDGNTWTPLEATTHEFITGGPGTTVVYDHPNTRILALGQTIDHAALVDTLYELPSTGTQWNVVCDGCSGVRRLDASLAHIPDAGETYMMNGWANNDEIAGTWVLDHEQFIQSSDDVGKRDSTGVAYDPARDRVVLYGGNGKSCRGTSFNCDETWELVATP